MNTNAQIKIIGSNGQISLGKEFSGRIVMLDKVNEGTWIIKSGEFIPDTEKWLYQGSNLSKLDRALDWIEKNPPKDNFDELMSKLQK